MNLLTKFCQRICPIGNNIPGSPENPPPTRTADAFAASRLARAERETRAPFQAKLAQERADDPATSPRDPDQTLSLHRRLVA